MVPMPAGLGNQFGLVFVRLPTGETDQGRRRARVKAQIDQVKSSHEGAFVSAMLEWMGQLPAAMQNAWVDAFAGKATAIVTNVSGPRHRVQIAGTPVAGMMGWVPVTGPLGLGLSIVSYAGQLSVGLASDAHLLPDHDRLLALLDDEIGTIPAYFGKGSSLCAAGLGTVSLCPLPTYLLQAGDAQQPQLLDLDKLDRRLMYGQILALARTIGTLDALPASAL